MDYLSHNISINLRRIRQSKSMSLEQAAEQTGVSKSMLAQIEKARQIRPSVCSARSRVVCASSFSA